jgi:uncharacterized protein (TIGR03435 family)
MLSKWVFTTVLLIVIVFPLRAGAIPLFWPLQSPQLSFEVASIKPGTPGDRGGKFATMQGGHQFVVRNYRVKDLVAFAYNLPPRLISGGPAWADADVYNILAGTPGEARPNLDEQMAMVRSLLDDRFLFRYHREQRELPVYELTVAKNGPKLTPTAAPPNTQPQFVSRAFPGSHVQLPGRNVTMTEFASELGRGILDRPVIDRTSLTGKYDFDLEWEYDDTQFGGHFPPINAGTSGKPDLLEAIQQQLGLRLEPARAQVETIIIDSVQQASEN